MPPRVGEVLGVHRPKQLVGRDAVVEAVDELDEERLAADAVEERSRRHDAKLRGRRLRAARV